jgi:hypothetical protein
MALPLRFPGGGEIALSKTLLLAWKKCSFRRQSLVQLCGQRLRRSSSSEDCSPSEISYRNRDPTDPEIYLGSSYVGHDVEGRIRLKIAPRRNPVIRSMIQLVLRLSLVRLCGSRVYELKFIEGLLPIRIMSQNGNPTSPEISR